MTRKGHSSHFFTLFYDLYKIISIDSTKKQLKIIKILNKYIESIDKKKRIIYNN
ncbi:hypothetical protein IMSAGC018_00642 [Lachnospiraceae bacterium]|jgi:hypothetical protein|nr:hypothetical protein IMSAGC018_00642 [Lachnospiraceae bacterium]